MGYNEQIGVANRLYRERRARMSPARRRFTDFATNTAWVIAGIAAWAMLLSPLWVLVSNLLRPSG